MNEPILFQNTGNVQAQAVPEDQQKTAEPEIEAAQVMREFEAGRTFNSTIGLYDTVEQNENFYIGDQWKGVNAPDLDKPVFNILSRVVRFFISSIMSDDIGISVERFEEDPQAKPVLDMLGSQFSAIMENTQYKRKCRDVIRNAAVDGDGAMHYWFDPDADPDDGVGYGTPGEIRAEILDNTSVLFGVPLVQEIKSQPFILISYRRTIEEVRTQAEQSGCDPDIVSADADPERRSDLPDSDRVTVVRRYWKKNGTVWCCEVVAGGWIRMPWDTGYTEYPIAWFSWEKVRGQYHGQAALTPLVPNQIYINKLYALAMQHVKNMAFPKIVYDSRKLPDGWDNRVGAAIGVPGDPNTAVASGFKAPDMSAQVMQLIDKVITETRDTMGASDAALGNVSPTNTSAIIATQKATSMPLELQKQDFYSFVEDSVRIWMDMMTVNYGVRPVLLKMQMQQMMTAAPGEAGMVTAGTTGSMPEGGMLPGAGAAEDKTVQVPFDFSALSRMRLKLNVEVGAATYWSELMQVQTMDNLFAKGLINGPTYLENIPNGYIPNRAELLKKLKEDTAAAQQKAQMQSGQQSGTGALMQAGAGQGAG